MPYNWILDQLEPNVGLRDSYDSAKDPVTVLNLGTMITLMVSDPDMVQDLFVQKNALYDKTGILEGAWSKLMGTLSCSQKRLTAGRLKEKLSPMPSTKSAWFT